MAIKRIIKQTLRFLLIATSYSLVEDIWTVTLKMTSTSPKQFCLWPPQVERIDDLGYLEDTSGRHYPRDGGRSSPVHGLAVYQFGDTFAHDATGTFVGLSCSNNSVVLDPRVPQLSTYMDVFLDGTIPVNPPLVQGEEMNDDWRTTTWCFGGIVFDDKTCDNIIRGYTFFQKSHINRKRWEEVIQHTGVANVSFDTSTKQVSVSRTHKDDILFGKSEPMFGTFSTHLLNGYVYAYGHGAESREVMLARVPFNKVRDRESYQFWDGRTYQDDISKSASIMSGLQHGSIFRSRLFEPNTGKDWVFIGCNIFADSNVLIGVAPNPEGPWELVKLIPAPPKTPQPDSGFTYCMYAHPWAYGESKGELMITWSEGGMKGKIVAVKVKFAQHTTAKAGGTKRLIIFDTLIKKLRGEQ
ncbi:hypothetical protein F5884DRAFT_795348 [Xylogone sp. PMI_703]|nr:hypothetical protein F5884DRAFT_795348 [Xylogone sp. PMI_703]